jgi:hypothetical protein
VPKAAEHAVARAEELLDAKRFYRRGATDDDVAAHRREATDRHELPVAAWGADCAGASEPESKFWLEFPKESFADAVDAVDVELDCDEWAA